MTCWKVIGTYRSPIAPELTDGQNGLLVPFNEQNVLAQAFIGLLKNPAQRAQIGTATLDTIEQHFCLTQRLESYPQLFMQLNQISSESRQRSSAVSS